MTLLEKAAQLIRGMADPDLAAEAVLAIARAAFRDEERAEAERAAARDRKQRQRDKSRDIGVTSAVTAPGQNVTSHAVPPNPPSGSSPDLFRLSPDPSKPDQDDPHSDERPGPLTKYSSNFVAFWAAYPNKVGKEAAWKAWKKRIPALPDVIGALTWQRSTKKWREGFIPNPATYLNEKRWLDEPGQRRDIDVTAKLPEVKSDPPAAKERVRASWTQPESVGALMDELPGWANGGKP